MQAKFIRESFEGLPGEGDRCYGLLFSPIIYILRRWGRGMEERIKLRNNFVDVMYKNKRR